MGLVESSLIAQNKDRSYELWHSIPVDSAYDYTMEQAEDAVPLLEYEDNLYCWATTETDLAVLTRQIAHDLGK